MSLSDTICNSRFHTDLPKYQCPKCGSKNVIIFGGMSMYANTGKSYSVEFVDRLKCDDCKFYEDHIKEDGNSIFSDLEKEWIKECPCKLETKN